MKTPWPWQKKVEKNTTGLYKYYKGRLVKVSDHSLPRDPFDVHVPSGGYYSENLESWVGSKNEKRDLLKKSGFREVQ